MPKPVLHGRDHRPGGSDPIEGLGGGGGIDYEIDNQTGLWLEIFTTSATAGKAMRLYDEGGNGIDIRSYGSASGNTAAVDLYGEDSITLTTASPSGGSSGDISLTAGDDILITATDTANIRANNGDMIINGDDSVRISCDVGYIEMYADTTVTIEAAATTSFADAALMLRAADGTLRTESQDLYMQLGDPVSGVISYADFAQELQLQADNVIVLVSAMIQLIGLPTSDPGVSGALWNSSGNVKISP